MANVNLYRASIPKGAYSKVSWTECDINPGPVQYLQDGLLSIDFQALNNSVSASSVATVSVIGYCLDDCTGCYLIGQTTTTSTTIPPVNFTITTSCDGSGVNGTGRITIGSFTGGSGTYVSVGIGTSAGQAFSATPTLLSGATSFDYTSITNNTYFVILRDSTGAYTTKNITVSCTNTTTTTTTSTTSTTTTTAAPTTTTTTAAPNCIYNGGTAVVVYPTTSTTSTTTAASTTTTTTTTTSPSLFTMDWNLSPKNGGNGVLSVLDKNNTEIFSQATGVTATSGTFTTAISNAPVTIKMSWSAGSSNIVRYRICDINGEIYYGPDIDNSVGSDSYLLSPTPSYVSVYATSGASTYPSICPS